MPEPSAGHGGEVFERPPGKQTGIVVRLVGTDGNAFAILGAVRHAMRHAGVEQAVIDQFVREATAGDYDHLLRVVMEYVEVG